MTIIINKTSIIIFISNIIFGQFKYQIFNFAANSRMLIIMKKGSVKHRKIAHFWNKLITNEIINYVLIVHVICIMSVSKKQRNIPNFREFVDFSKF